MKEYIIPDDFLDYETMASADGQGFLRELVRCRECKYAHLTYDGDIKYCDLLAVKDEYGDCDPCFYRSGDWFCADGERKDGAE